MLVRLADEKKKTVMKIFEYPAKNCPELLLMGLASIPGPSWSGIREEMIDSLFPIFVGPRPRPSSWNVIGSMWTIDKKLVVRTIVNMYLKDNKALQRCLKIALELENCLPILLSLPPHAFVVELATAASASSVAARKNQKLNLEQWLNQRLMDASTASSFAAVVVQWMQVQNLPLQILFVFMKSQLEQERDDTCDRGAFRETVPSLRATISSDADDR